MKWDAGSPMLASVLTRRASILAFATSMGLSLVVGCGGAPAMTRPSAPTVVPARVASDSEHSRRPVANKVAVPTGDAEDPWADDDDEVTLVRRPLTGAEKESVIAAYELEKQQAFTKASEQRLSEDRLTAGIHKREVEKIASKLQSELTRIDDALAARKMSRRAASRARAAANKRAKLATERSRRSSEQAISAAAKIEREAQRKAIATFEQNCRDLDSAIVADYIATPPGTNVSRGAMLATEH